MKHEKFVTGLCAALLSIAAAVGTTGCFVTAFDLPLADSTLWFRVCVVCSLICGAALSFRHGEWVLMGILALALGYLWRDGVLAEQGIQLAYRLGRLYDRAYDLGLLSESSGAWRTTPADWPVALLAGLVGITVCRCLCGGRRIWPGVLACVMPLLSCIVVTDTVPEEGYLFLWMAALILLILPTAVRRENALQGLRLTAMAALPVLLFLSGLFLAVPQTDYVNKAESLRTKIFQSFRTVPEKLEIGVIQMASDLRAGEPEQVDLRIVGPQIPFTYPVMEVTAQVSGSLYLRGQDYDAYDGLGWSATKGRREVFGLAGPAEDTLTITTRSELTSRYLPYYAPAELAGGRTDNPDRAKTYTLDRSVLPGNWRLTAYGTETAVEVPAEFAPYLELPQHTRQQAEAMLKTFHQSGSHTAKADAIAAFVTHAARYDRNTPAMPREETDFALWFLSQSETGYCIHFATAATVLLRAAGVPARYVTGYLTETKANEPKTVTEEDAHAWAEYYEPLLGCWIPLEATPAEPEEWETVPVTVTQPTRLPLEPVEPEQTQPVTRETEPEIAQNSTTAPMEPGDQIPQKEPKTPWFALLLVPMLLVTTVTQRALRLEIYRNRSRSGSPNAQALARWREAVRLGRLLRDSPPEELLVLAQKAKFSNHQLKGEELQLFDAYIRSCHRQLKKKSSLHQLVYRYIYVVY